MDDLEIQQLDDLESSHFWYMSRKSQLTKSLNSFGCGPLRVLDLGSATGGNTLHISSLGHYVTSVEYSDIGVKIQKHKGIPVVQADARKLPFSDKSFDVVVCLDVLEHIEEDYLVASEISRVLVNEGHFLISVPEDPKLWSAHDVAVNHLRRYTKKALISVIQQAKLSPENIWSNLYLLRPSILLIRKFSKGSDLYAINSLLNRIFYFICNLELILPMYRGKGVTLWMHGKKL
jgi:SAM-dependent methyltransferase